MVERLSALALTLATTASFATAPVALGAALDLPADGAALLHCYRPTARSEKAVAISEGDVLVRGHFGRLPNPAIAGRGSSGTATPPSPTSASTGAAASPVRRTSATSPC